MIRKCAFFYYHITKNHNNLVKIEIFIKKHNTLTYPKKYTFFHKQPTTHTKKNLKIALIPKLKKKKDNKRILLKLICL